MADPATPPADNPPADTPPADQTPPPSDPPADPPKGEDEGKGGKSAILADLAKERDARQALERQIADLQAAQQTQLDGIAKALGLKSDDTPPDPAKLTEQLTVEQKNAREAQVQLAVYRNAAQFEGNADALLDSASFLRSLADVDPTDTAAVGAAIKAAVEANPRLKATDPNPFPTPGQAGIGVSGGGAQPSDPTAADLAQIEADLVANRRR
jgi:cytochrome c556